jgi:hypothetical protein
MKVPRAILIAPETLYYLNTFKIALPTVKNKQIIYPQVGIVSIPVIGFLLNSLPLYACFTLLWLLTLIFSLFTLAPLSFQIGSILLISFIRPLFFSLTSSYIQSMFKAGDFGIIYGSCLLIASLVNLLQYPMIRFGRSAF